MDGSKPSYKNNLFTYLTQNTIYVLKILSWGCVAKFFFMGPSIADTNLLLFFWNFRFEAYCIYQDMTTIPWKSHLQLKQYYNERLTTAFRQVENSLSNIFS